MIWFTSDLHFNHDREFVWGARGFTSVQEMNEAIVARHNALIKPEDTLYILGDVMLGGQDTSGIDLLAAINGQKIIIAGNHDTERRRELYTNQLGIPVYDALAIKVSGYHLYLSHYPTLTANLEAESLRRCTINFFGHTHQTTNFYNDMPFMYHVGVDSHNCFPVPFDTALADMTAKVEECKAQL